jgi:proteasome lid subunit RPN8/RPN11
MIQIKEGPLSQIIEHAESIFPDECCGFMYGVENAEGNRIISEIRMVNNAKPGDKRRRFEITGRDYMMGERYAVEKDLLFLGIYHSHPNHPAIPSEHDRVAAQPFFSYIIVSVKDGRTDHIRSWRLNDSSQFEEEKYLPVQSNQTIPWQQ